jgi:hypothetical protein
MQGKLKLAVLVLAAWGVALGACDDGKQELDENLRVDNTTPTGAVGGVVYDAVTEGPIAGGAEVTVIAGGYEPMVTTTDSAGYFLVEEVPASGNIVVLIKANGYYSINLNGRLENNAGDFPVENAILSLGPVGLVPANGSLPLRLMSENGAPIPNVALTATTQVRYMDYSSGTPMAAGKVTLSATADGQGRVTLSGLPDYAGLGSIVNDLITLSFPPIDQDGDGIYEYPGGDRNVYASNTQAPERVIVLDTFYNANLYVVSSTIQALEGGSSNVTTTIEPNGPIHVLFSLPIEESSLYVRVKDEFGQNTNETNTSVDGGLLTIDFPQPLESGAEYNLQIHAVSSVTDQYVDADLFAPFFTVPNEALQLLNMVRDPDTDEIVLYFNQPIGTGNAGWNQNFYGEDRCVLWFGVELEGGDPNGLDAGEWGHPSCNLGAAYKLYADEEVPDMPGAYPSGFTTRWRFLPPNVSGGTAAPTGTPFYITFADVGNVNYLVTTPGGTVAHNFVSGQTLP